MTYDRRALLGHGGTPRVPGHRLEQVGGLMSKEWRCQCGGWTFTTPAVGPWGRTTMAAKMAAVRSAHWKHAKHHLHDAD